jgi:hypothetical protein
MEIQAKCFQALPENVPHFENKSEDDKAAKMIEMKEKFTKFQRLVKGMNAVKALLLEMYMHVSLVFCFAFGLGSSNSNGYLQFGAGVFLDRFWDVRIDVESKSKGFGRVRTEIVKQMKDDVRLQSIQENNRAALLSVVQVLAGDLHGAEMQEHIEEFFEDFPTTFSGSR